MALKDLTSEELLRIKGRDETRQRDQRDEEIFKNIKVLIEACHIAQQHGAYTLKEARHIMNAVDVLTLKDTSHSVDEILKMF